MEKSSDALRTISEVSTELDIPKHVLRFWESKFKQIKPMKRGGGRRYYRPADMTLLIGIRHLLYAEGFTIRGVQQIFKREGVDYIKSIASDNVDIGAIDMRPKKSEKSTPGTKSKITKPALKESPDVLQNLLREVENCKRILTDGVS